MEELQQKIFWGTFTSDSDDFFIQETGNTPFIAVEFSPFPVEDEGRIGSLADHRQQVSILGHMGELTATELGEKTPSITATKIASHRDIAQQAFGIFESGRGASAFDNWLLAERQVLGI